MGKIILYCFLFSSILGKAQLDICNKLHLDTVLLLNEVSVNGAPNITNTKLAVSSNFFLLAYKNPYHYQNIHFILFDRTLQYKCYRFSFRLDKLKLKNNDLLGVAFDENNQKIVACYQYNILVFDVNKPNQKLRLVSNISISTYYNYAHSVKGKLFLSAIYGNNDDGKALVSVFDVNSSIHKTDFEFVFPKINFTTLYPSQQISFSENFFALGKTDQYHVSVYDHNGNLFAEVVRPIPNWKSIPDSIWAHLKEKNLINVLDTIVSLDKRINRIDGIWLLNDSTLFVRYSAPCERGWPKDYFMDVYQKGSNGFDLRDSGLTDFPIPIDINKMMTKRSTFVESWNYVCHAGSDLFVVVKNYADIDYLNRTWTAIKADEWKYYETNNPIYSIFVYRYTKP